MGASRVLSANLALIAANALFGFGNVVSQITLHGVNPAFFALIREIVSGPLLLLVALLTGGGRVQKQDRWRFLITGVSLFCTNFLYMVGVKIGGSYAAGFWQPMQPVMITCMAVAMRYEQCTLMKFGGIVLAGAGILFYSLYGKTNEDSKSATDQFIGNVLFCAQIVGCSVWWVFQKPLIQRQYSAITILGWSYMVASVCMTIAVVTINSQKVLIDVICPDCHGEGWYISGTAWLGIAYWTFPCSMGAYYLQTWGNQYVDASLLGIYSVVQPIVTMVSGLLVISCTTGDHYGLSGLTPACAGFIGIVFGLLLVVYDNLRNGQKKAKTNMESSKLPVAQDDNAGVDLLKH